jgi:hypothetical protein
MKFVYGDDDDRLGFWLTRELGERFDDGNCWREFRCVNPVNSEVLLEELGLRFDYEFLLRQLFSVDDRCSRVVGRACFDHQPAIRKPDVTRRCHHPPPPPKTVSARCFIQ